MPYAAQKGVRSFAAAASLLIAAISLPSASFITNTDTNATSAPVTAQLCSGGQYAPGGLIVSPTPSSIVAEKHVQLHVKTHWATSYKVYGNDKLLAENTDVTYASETITAVPVELPPGQSSLRLSITGGCPETSVSTESITLTFSQATATVKPLETNARSPRLTGLVSDPTAKVTIYIQGKAYSALNMKNGTWVLPAGSIHPDLADGDYTVRVVASNADGIISDTTQKDSLRINTTPPNARMTLSKSSDRSPELRGVIDDPFASVDIHINDRTYSAQNNGDGTWILPGGTIQPLANGTYEVHIFVKDNAGNTANFIQLLSVQATNELAFLLAPNTGFLRLHKTNIPSWLLYLFAAIAVVLFTWFIKARTRKRPSTES